MLLCPIPLTPRCCCALHPTDAALGALPGAHGGGVRAPAAGAGAPRLPVRGRSRRGRQGRAEGAHVVYLSTLNPRYEALAQNMVLCEKFLVLTRRRAQAPGIRFE